MIGPLKDMPALDYIVIKKQDPNLFQRKQHIKLTKIAVQREGWTLGYYH